MRMSSATSSDAAGFFTRKHYAFYDYEKYGLQRVEDEEECSQIVAAPPIAEYIRSQPEDYAADQNSIREYADPLTLRHLTSA